jgi:hypothetical protein
MTPYCKSLNGVLAIENNIFQVIKTTGRGRAEEDGMSEEGH